MNAFVISKTQTRVAKVNIKAMPHPSLVRGAERAGDEAMPHPYIFFRQYMLEI